ncbi:MAG TPA: DUF58 domain-containing protein [Verrucomicrobiae bacterium]
MKWIIGALVLLVAGLVLRLELLVYAMYVLLGVLLVSRLLARTWIESLSAKRKCEEAQLEVGGTLPVKVTLSNSGALAVPWALVEDSLPTEALQASPAQLQIEGPRLGLVRVPSRGEKVIEYSVTFLRRGYYQVGPLLVESGDLFGLHRRYRVLTLPHYVTVLPHVVPLEGYDIASHRPLGEIRLTHRLFEDTARISGVRQYVEGDALNRIHWRATARTGVLQCKTFEPSCIAGATLVLDFHKDSFNVPGAEYRAELGVTTVVSIANALYELGEQFAFATNARDGAERVATEGWRFEFTTRDAAQKMAAPAERKDRLRPVVIEPNTGDEHFTHLRETLARVEWNDGLTLSQLLNEVESRLSRDTTVIVVVPQITEEMAFALGALQRNGFKVFAVMITFGDEDYHDWAKPPVWAGRLLAEGVEFRWIFDEAGLSSLCASEVWR